MEVNNTDLIKTLKNERMKRFFVRDGSLNIIEVYETRIDAIDQDPCLKTTYEYFAGETVVEKMKEENALWSAAYDI